MPDIVITEFMDEAAIEPLREGFSVVYDPGLVDDPARLSELLPDTRALIVRNRTQVRGELLAAAGRLECVGRLGVGLDNIDMAECRGRGIAVYPATGANTLAVAEYVIAAALMLLRGAYHSTGDMIAGKWPRQQLSGREVSGKVLGLVGFGAIARETARRASALGMTAIACDPFLPENDPAWALARRANFEDVLSEADVLSLHVPLTAETRGLIGADAFARMKEGAVIINTARGGVLDGDALAEALRGGRLGGAALDVFETEPLTEAAAAKFAGLSHVILTPHIAGITAESNVRVSSMIAEAVLTHLSGKQE